MSKTTTTKHPQDEFDLVDPGAGPAGVHRAPRSAWRRATPFLVVMVVCAALAAGTVIAYFELGGTPPTTQAQPSTPATDGAEAPATDDGAEAPAEDPAAEDPAAETPAAEEPTVEPEAPVVEEPADVVDTGTAVRVLNATGRSGVAATAAEVLTDADWSDVVADNFSGTDPASSVVYFKNSDSEAEAREVARLLEITQVLEAPNLVGPVSVVLVGSYGR